LRGFAGQFAEKLIINISPDSGMRLRSGGEGVSHLGQLRLRANSYGQNLVVKSLGIYYGGKS